MEKRTKFNVDADKEKRSYDGIVFDSELERNYYRDVILPQMASGTIISCERQKCFVLQPAFKNNGKTVQAITYKADFVLAFADGTERVIDCKGYATPDAVLKKKMFLHVFPAPDYLWMSYSACDGGWLSYEELQQKRKARKKLKNGLDKENSDWKEKLRNRKRPT